MVRLSVSEFARGARRMQEIAGTKKARLAIRMRRKDRKIVLRMTDDVNTLTAVVTKQNEFPVLERIVSDYINGCIVEEAPSAVPAEPKEAAPSTSNANTSGKGGKGGNNTKPAGGKGGKGKKK